VTPQRDIQRHFQVEGVGRLTMLSKDLAEHVAVVRRHEDALDDDVVPQASAVADCVGEQTDVVSVRDIVLAQNDSAQMVLSDVGRTRAEGALKLSSHRGLSAR
jgi:hypothetical protein